MMRDMLQFIETLKKSRNLNPSSFFEVKIEIFSGAGAVISANIIVDGVFYQTTSESIIDSSLRGIFAPHEPLLDRADQNGSISRSFQRLTLSAFLFVSSTPGVSNACKQQRLQTTVSVKEIDFYNCCVGASVFCAFK